ncbi:MAG: archaetidylserine decarboxylase, partial [Myxococcota bacterium]
RPIDPREDVVVSPTDGALAAHGRIDGGTLIQAKGRTYALSALLAEDGADEPFAEIFANGSYATMYLSPRDYHRVHMPVMGRITGITHISGDLFPVNLASVETVDGLYARNERVVVHATSSQFGRVAVVLVGATNVGRITLTHCADIVTNTRAARTPPRRWTPTEPIALAAGAELAVFELGSTVIVVTETPIEWFTPRSPVRMGMALGQRARL